MKKAAGMTLIELILVLLLLTIISTAVVINIGPAVTSIQIEQVAAEVSAAVAKSRFAAIEGNNSVADRTFQLSKALPTQPRGILLRSHSTTALANCSSTCGVGMESLCVSGTSFCYQSASSSDSDNELTFTFDNASGKLAHNQAIFINSKNRQLAVLVNREGRTEIAEEIQGQWRLRTDLQKLTARK